jgi:hypothetical protein
MSNKTTQQKVVLPVAITTDVIKKVSAETIRVLIRTYGASAVNDRIFGR